MSDSTALDEKVVTEAAEIDIFNSKGEKVKFGSLFENQKTVVVFIRHFFCGICQTYVKSLGAVPKEALEHAGIKIVVIGCGEAAAIDTYADITEFTGGIYTDPSRALYHALGMTIESFGRTPEGQQRKSYLTTGSWTNVFQSIWRGPVHNPSLVGKQGNIKQLGGDFIFGPGNSCSFASHMQNTEDHAEVADLMRAAGVTFP